MNDHFFPSAVQRQGGIVLFIAIIAIVVMALAAIALIRSTETAGVVAGNMAFKQATSQASDVGVELAYAALPNILTTSLEQDIANQYFATLQPVDAQGIPTTINWATLPCYDTNASQLNTCSDNSTYRIQYVIDRQCLGPTPVNDIVNNCLIESVSQDGSKKSGAAVFSSATRVYYRVTIRVLGPRDTISIAQASIAY